MVLKQIKRSLAFLTSPKENFKKSKKRTFESILGDYMILLVLAGSLAFLFNVVFTLLRSAYFDLMNNVDINYLNVLNYGFGIGFSLFFFYLFAGTFLLFFISIILKLFFPKIDYFNFLRILFLSFSPIVLFGWIPFLAPSLFIWAVFLFFTGVKEY